MPLTKRKVKKTAEEPESRSKRKVDPAEVWATLNEIAKLQKENERARKENEKAWKENEKATAEVKKALKETQKIVGGLGNRFGDFSEATLVPDLKRKFRKYGFIFEKLTGHVSIEDEEDDIHAEIDAMLENGDAAIVVEVKTTLKRSDVDEHKIRMEKVRKYADKKNDRRKFYGAIAATIVDKDTRLYVLNEGFYLVEPSGESVKIIPPVSAARLW